MILFADEETEAGEYLPCLLLTLILERLWGSPPFRLPTHLSQRPLTQDQILTLSVAGAGEVQPGTKRAETPEIRTADKSHKKGGGCSSVGRVPSSHA